MDPPPLRNPLRSSRAVSFGCPRVKVGSGPPDSSPRGPRSQHARRAKMAHLCGSASTGSEETPKG
eukprot:3208948-Alexandrium_andersonii.AAC.1